MKNIIWVLVLIVLIGGGFFYFSKKTNDDVMTEKNGSQGVVMIEGASVVPPGSYVVVPTESEVKWSAGKPLIEGYINNGTFALKEGSITVSESTATGTFVFDMNSLSVSLTAKKPGKESALENHLKGKDFFDVEKFPTAQFVIKQVVATEDSATSLAYTVTGDLTIKGVTNEVTFPATIYLKDGAVHAEGTLEIDRTKWNITFGSANFFDNLADNAISDTVSLSLNIVARSGEAVSDDSSEVVEE